MRRTIAMAVAMITGLVLVAGCGDDEIVEVTQPPAIQVRVQAAPTSVDTGEKVAVQAIIERAPAGATLQYSWIADGGVFSASDDDSTGWTAPDNPGIYAVSVVVTDGKNAGIGSADVGVATYLPADSPYYKGATSCSVCHNGGPGGDQYATWSVSAHSTALQSLVDIGVGENPNCLPCHTVGSYGLGANAELGFDLPFAFQEKISFTDGGGSDEFDVGDLVLYGKFKQKLATHCAGAIGL
jgi:hypothetical protein